MYNPKKGFLLDISLILILIFPKFTNVFDKFIYKSFSYYRYLYLKMYVYLKMFIIEFWFLVSSNKLEEGMYYAGNSRGARKYYLKL